MTLDVDTFHFARPDGRVTQYVYEIGSYHYNWHAAIEVSVVLTGQVEMRKAGEAITLNADDVIVVNSMEGHATLSKAPGTEVLLLQLDPRLFANFLGSRAALHFTCLTTPTTRYTPRFTQLRGLMADMMLMSADDSPFARLRYHRDLLSLMYLLASSFATDEGTRRHATNDGHEAIADLLEWIAAHSRERLTLAMLGERAGYNATYVSSLFTKELGISFSDYLTRLRLRDATNALTDKNRKISDVALEAGFPDVKAFNRAFRATFGRTPTDYRAELTEAHLLTDSTFHVTYVPRTDAETDRILHVMADALRAADDAHLAAEESQLEQARAALDALSAQVATQAAGLEAIRDQIAQLAGDLGKTIPSEWTDL